MLMEDEVEPKAGAMVDAREDGGEWIPCRRGGGVAEA